MKPIEQRWKWDVTKRQQYQKERRKKRYAPFVLCALQRGKWQTEGCVHDTPGTFVQDQRGRLYVVARNSYGQSAGLVRVDHRPEIMAAFENLAPRTSFSSRGGSSSEILPATQAVQAVLEQAGRAGMSKMSQAFSRGVSKFLRRQHRG